MVRLDCSCCVVRSWRWRDLQSLSRNANSLAVWLKMRDRFPHPYRVEEAAAFLAAAYLKRIARRIERSFAIDVQGQAVGGIGFLLGTDVHARTAELYYWLGEAFWGRGIATAAVKNLAAYAFVEHRLHRVFALPFASNPASARVLEKAGFTREGVLRMSAIKDGSVLDQWVYAVVPEDTRALAAESQSGDRLAHPPRALDAAHGPSIRLRNCLSHPEADDSRELPSALGCR